MMMPGVQKPHCDAPWAAKHSAHSLGVGQPGERRDLAPSHAGDRRHAGDPRMAVDPDRAAPALALRAAAVLGGARAEAIAQDLEERRVVRLDLDVPAVEAEANQLS